MENPEFFKIMDKLVEHNGELSKIGKSDMPDALKTLARLPHFERMFALMFQLMFVMKPSECGTADLADNQSALVY